MDLQNSPPLPWLAVSCLFILHQQVNVSFRKTWVCCLLLCKKCPYLHFFWSLFSCIRIEYGEIRSILLYSVRLSENTDQKNSEYEHFSRIVCVLLSDVIFILLSWILQLAVDHCTAQKMKLSIKDFFSKCEQIRRRNWICSHLLKKSLMENFIFCVVFQRKMTLHVQIISTDLQVGLEQLFSR